MSTSNLTDLLDRISFDHNKFGQSMVYQPVHIQERFFEMSFSFIKELALSNKIGYVNGNMELSEKARVIVETLLTNNIQV